MNNNQGTNADTDFQFRIRKIKNGMLVLHGGETTFCGSMASVKLAIKEALKNYEQNYEHSALDTLMQRHAAREDEEEA